MNITTLAIGGGGLFVLIVLGLLVHIFRSINSLNTSFAKLGYVTREDAKKYFGDAADKVVDMNSSFTQQYQKMIEDAVRHVLNEGGQVMEGSLAKAQQDAGQIILKAQQDAQELMRSKQKEAARYFERAIGQSVEAIEWAMEQYAHENLSVQQHEAIINKLVESYLNERRSH